MQSDPRHNSSNPAPDAAEPASFHDPEVTPEQIARAVVYGQQLRAQTIAKAARQVTGRLHGLLSRVRPTLRGRKPGTENSLSVLASGLRSPLTAIRSAAEILRDYPDLDPDRRERFIAIVLMEEARLESLVTEMLEASSFRRGSRVWQLQLSKLGLDCEAPGRCPSLDHCPA